MAQYYDAANRFGEILNEPGVNTFVYCKRFSDMVTDKVCVVRRQVLAAKPGCSCKSCIINIRLDQRFC